MSNKALDYAENKLGVHEVWESTQADISALDTLLGDLDKALDRRRELDEKYTAREVELAGEMRGVHASMSDTRFKSEWKGWEYGDAALTTLRGELAGARGDIQGLEMDKEVLAAKIKAGCARMEQLGGYLNYLAAVKNQAENAKKPTGEQ